MATTYTLFIDGTLRNPITQQVIEINKYLRVYRNMVDFASQAIDAGLSDVCQVLQLPKNIMVLQAWLRVVSACPANATADFGYGSDPDYFGNGLALDAIGIAGTMLTGSETWDPSAIADGNEETKDITVNGASLGDIVQCSFSLDVADLGLTGAVVAADTVTAQLWDNAGGADINLGSGTVIAYVNKAPLAINPLLLTASDTLDLVATTDTADVNLSSGIVEAYALVMSINQHGF
jgi:hypothetical protein